MILFIIGICIVYYHITFCHLSKPVFLVNCIILHNATTYTSTFSSCAKSTFVVPITVFSKQSFFSYSIMILQFILLPRMQSSSTTTDTDEYNGGVLDWVWSISVVRWSLCMCLRRRVCLKQRLCRKVISGQIAKLYYKGERNYILEVCQIVRHYLGTL